ncbi:MAG TPA: 4-alpha-glucanotransferase, partial [Chroococcales cyanobacterium]
MPIDLKNKLAGILVPVFALRHANDLGIGDTTAMKDAIEFCRRNKIGVLQILPINETGGDNSPYNAISSQALEPAYITISPQAVPGLAADDISKAIPDRELATLREGSVNYAVVKKLKLELLGRAFARFQSDHLQKGSDLARQFAAFEKQNERWLPAYTLYRALIDKHAGNTAWPQWQEPLRSF